MWSHKKWGGKKIQRLNGLEQGLAKAKVDDIKHGSAGEDGAPDDGNETEHGKAAVNQLSLRGQACLEGGDEASGGLGLVALLLHKCVLYAAELVQF